MLGFKKQTFPFFKEGRNGYAVLTLEGGRYRDGMLKMVMRYYNAIGQQMGAFFVGSGAPDAQIIEHPSRDYAGSQRPIPEGWYFMDKPIRMGSPEAGVGYVKVPLDQTRLAQNNRSDLLIHLDYNRSWAPGTLGCVFPSHDADLERMIEIQERHNVTLLIVDYNLGFVDEVVENKIDDKCFEWAYQFVAKWEGGYVNDPSDPGGETNFGITQRVADEYGLGRVKGMTEEEAKAFYKTTYYRQWVKNWHLNLVMFDTAVNFGLQGSREFLQEALGFSGADVDGKVGPVTLGRLKKANADDLAIQIVERRIDYRQIRVKQSPSQKRFLAGWLNRDRALLDKIDN